MSSASSVATLPRVHERHAWRTEWFVLGALLVLAFLPVLRWMYERWTAADSYTSHGFLVPLISAYFVWSQREQLAREQRRPSAWGLALVVCALAVFCIGGLLRVYFTSGFALVLCLTGMLAYWGGWQWVRRLWFPLFFLIFMLPLPEVAIARANLWLKLVVARAAVTGVDAVGIPVVMDGARLQLQNTELVVGDVCSGLRSIIALIALGTLYAYSYGGKSGAVRSALLAAILPAAVIANVLRIVLNVVFVHFYGKDVLFSPLFSMPLFGEIDLHLLSGFLVFVFALLALQLTLLVADAVVRRRRSARGVAQALAPVRPAEGGWATSGRPSVVLAALLGAVCVLSWARLYPSAKAHAREDLSLFPRAIGTWTAVREYAATDREKELLETDNILTRVYRDPSGCEVTLVAVYDSSGDRKMAHPQEICLTADGLEALEKNSVELDGTGVRAERLLMERGARRVLFYYWYKAGAFQSGSYLGTQWRLAWASLAGSPGGTALVRISTAVVQDAARADEALQVFALALLPEVERYLP